MKAQAAIVFFIILIGSATFLRSASDPNQTHNPLELNDNNVSPALNNSSFFILDFYYPGCGPCKSVNNTTSKKYEISAYPTLLFFDEGFW